MKTERISIFNYEAFYLDHLEGNLGEEDTVLLLAFLEAHPELQLDDDAMPLVFTEDISLSKGDKNALKQTDNDEVITLLNVEYFMISEAEGLLSSEKEKELTSFIDAHPELSADRAYFGALTISPDLNEVYTEKSSLKQNAVMPTDNEVITLLNVEYFMISEAEGLLSSEKEKELTSFIDAHPELNADRVYFGALTISPDLNEVYTEKSSLKQNAVMPTDNEVITLLNVEYFMISEAEGLLSNEKERELSSFIEIHPELKADRTYFGALTLSPDLNEVYNEKSSLKRKKKTIVLWQYVSIAAAASVIIAFLLLTGSGADETSNFAKHDQKTIDQETPDKEENKLAPIDEVPQIALQEKEDESTQNSPQSPRQNAHNQDEQIDPAQFASVDRKVSPLNKRPVRKVLQSIEGYEIQPITNSIAFVPEEQENNEAVAYTGFEHMNDPIAPITSRLNKRLKSDVDFRTAKATKEQAGGFYIKIGKFELLRKKHKKQ